MGLRGFTLKFKHQFNGSIRNSMLALKLAYAIADLPSQQTKDDQSTAKKPSTDKPQDGQEVVTKHLPQIYFLTSGQPHGGVGQILEKIGEFDNGRHIPVNSIAFLNTSPDP